MRYVPSLLLLLCTLLPLQASDKHPMTIRLHPEANAKEGDTFTTKVELVNPPKTIAIKKVAVVNEKDIVAFYPFQSADGTIGAYFKLDASGTNRLEQHTVEARDGLVVAMLDGRVACAMRIDKKVTDGILMIPTGFAPLEIVKLQSRYPTMGKEKEFKEQQKKAQALLKETEKNKAREAKAQKKSS